MYWPSVGPTTAWMVDMHSWIRKESCARPIPRFGVYNSIVHGTISCFTLHPTVAWRVVTINYEDDEE
jgi:hypothetical protein